MAKWWFHGDLMGFNGIQWDLGICMDFLGDLMGLSG